MPLVLLDDLEKTMVQPVIGARRVYSRYVANQTLEDYSLRYTAKSARKRSALTVSNAALGSISFLALEVIGANIAVFYGLNHLLLALLVGMPLIFLISWPIAFYAVKYNVDIDLLTRGSGFGYLGSSVTSLVYASFTFIFLAFESTILSNMLYMAFSLPLWIGYLLSSVVIIPLILNGFTFISKFQRITQPLWAILQIISIIGAVLLVRDGVTSPEENAVVSKFSLTEMADNIKGDFNLLFFGYSLSILMALISQIGEQVDYLRFMPERNSKNSKLLFSGTLVAGPGWIILGSIKIVTGAVLAVYLLENGVPFISATDPNYMYLSAFRKITNFTGIDSSYVALALTVIFVLLCQIKINVTNGYAGSIAWSNFFSRLTHTHPGRVVWVFFNVIIAYLLTNYGIYSVSASVLNIYAVVAVAWCGTLASDLMINKTLSLSPKGIEYKRAYLYDINPVGFGAMVCSSFVGYLSYSGLLGQYAEAFCVPLTLLCAVVLTPCFAYITQGKYYLARKVDHIKGKHECKICKNTFDGEDLCYCPRYGGYICSLCCTLDSCCSDECKHHANIQYQIEHLLPEKFRTDTAKRIARFSGHLLLYTIANLSAVSISYYAVERNFVPDNRGALLSGFILCFLCFEVIFCIFSLMFTLIEESRRRSQDEFHSQNELLENEILERRKTEKLLSEAKKNADAANRAKSRYLSGISHELRTPLNTITGYSQLLSQSDDLPRRHSKAVRIINRSADYLSSLIEGLLDISKIEAGRLELHEDNVNLKQLLSELTDYFSERANEKSLNFEFKITGRLPECVKTDEKRLRQILTNLLSNAIKYTQHGYVRFYVRYRNEVADFSVSDSGIGIKEDDLKKIFEPFNRLDEARKSAAGTGLGLTITNLLTTIMGGELEVNSVHGQGSVFKVKMRLSESYSDPNFTRHEKTVSGYRNSGKHPFRVLEVDDNADHRELVCSILNPVGFITDTADCPDTVLTKTKEQLLSYDLYLVDVSMPGHDGWYLLKELRIMGIKSPIIMVSAEASEGNVPDSVRELHNGYIIKPFRQKTLFDAIARVLPVDYLYKEDLNNLNNEVTLPQKCNPDKILLTEDNKADTSSSGESAGVISENLSKVPAIKTFIEETKETNFQHENVNEDNKESYLDSAHLYKKQRSDDVYKKTSELSENSKEIVKSNQHNMSYNSAEDNQNASLCARGNDLRLHVKEKLLQYVDIGYISGIRKLAEKSCSELCVSNEFKEHLLELVDDMKLDEIRKLLEEKNDR